MMLADALAERGRLSGAEVDALSGWPFRGQSRLPEPLPIRYPATRSWLARDRMHFDQLNRREFITLVGGAAAWPLPARAQQPGKTPRVGYIRAGTPRNDPFREEFVRGMRDLGYVEGRNIGVEFRHYGDDVGSIGSLISDLLRAKVDVIVAGGTPAVRAAQAVTQKIPIVMIAADPLGTGLIASLARPGGNTTGLSVLSTE